MPYYRLQSAYTPSNGRDPLPAGTLVFTWRAGAVANLPAGVVPVSTSTNGWGSMMAIPVSVLHEANPAPKWTEFEQLARFYMEGRDVPPNLTLGTPETLDADLNMLVGGYGATLFSGRMMIPGDQHHGEQAMALMDRTQGGQLTGSATVLRYLSNWGPKDAVRPRTAKFKLCDHAKVTGAGANPQRGWHPGRCSKCGLDMTVDSGD